MRAEALPELAELRFLASVGEPHVTQRLLCEVAAGADRLPVHAYFLGTDRPKAPAVGFFGGVHGLERIGAEVVIAYLRSLVARLRWDESLHRMLESVRLVFVPLVNPVGVWRGKRANPNGVDLMRNAPVQAEQRALFMVGGQRLSPRLPWYRGAAGAPMEAEAEAVCALVRTELLPRPFSLAIDCHSGFGLRDRLWFPFAHSRRPIDHLPELHALGEVMDQALLHHRYVLEPQSRQYLAHGDLWDHLYLAACSPADGGQVFLPLTLEMGSWLWVKKNPLQVFSRHGIFNPQIEHRQRRVLRRHMILLDFLGRAAGGHARWLPQGELRHHHQQQALARWYGGAARPVSAA
jgi:hypothetical protein